MKKISVINRGNGLRAAYHGLYRFIRVHVRNGQERPAQTRIYTLDNGLKVYMSVNKAEPRIETYIAVKSAARTTRAKRPVWPTISNI